MSWLFNPEANPTRNIDDDGEVPDPLNPNVMVSDKSANRPFLAYKEYRKQEEQKHVDWLKRKQERDEKIARGEKVGPLERDPTEEVEVGLWGLIKFLSIVVMIFLFAGKFVTGSFIWEYDGKWARLKTYLPSNDRLFSEATLATYDGRDSIRPLYIAIDGDVYDVSNNRGTYGPGGSYHAFAGRDAARAYGTGCFQTHLTYDLRGLSDSERKSVEHWKKFFADHKTYRKVGKVSHPPIDPESPIPEHCNLKMQSDSNPKKQTKEQGSHPAPKQENHDEL